MNEKDGELYRIMDNVIQCCSVLTNDGRAKVSRELLISRCRKENVVMVRTLVVSQIYAAGYTVSTIADFLHRVPQSIYHMLDKAYFLSRNSRAYRIAEKEAAILNMIPFENLDVATEQKRLETSDMEREVLLKLYKYSHDNNIPEFDAVIIWSDAISVHLEISYSDYKPTQVVQEEILHLDDRIEEVNTVRNYSEDVIGALAERLIIDDSIKINIGQKEITFHDYFYNLLRHQNFAC